MEQFTKLRKVLYLKLVLLQRTQVRTSQMKRHRVRSGSVPNTELLCPLPMESGYIILLVCVCLPARKLT